MKNELSIYIHWPFCKTKCPYCDFNSHENDSIDHDIWQEAYLREIDLYGEMIANKKVKTIFFGGGTPSLMRPHTVDAILTKIASKTDVSDEVEITLEANPNSIERESFYSFKQAGINRVSIGVQSFKDENLKFLGRSHSYQDAVKAIDIACSVFSNYSFDLIYALPNQTVNEWEKELSFALQYIAHHISCYQLTIEKGTQFFTEHRRKAFCLPNEEISASMYELTHNILKTRAIHQYEVSNYAKDGFECKHNMVYWKLGDYIGIGPGAHGRYETNDVVYSCINCYSPSKWRESLKNGKLPIQSKKMVTNEEQRVEKLVMGLRLNEGININTIQNKPVAEKLVNEGFLTCNKDMLATTLKGRLVLNAILSDILGPIA
ncbi:radical SAM family heme chaperone HemW [Candidatus Bandiella euplotis]|uniref:Heme chaperone HemW n=1 Tax=Candidatus Bandiella euplotis TaxID=1664265 RepID=A0ABZ0UK92_9RICK|nr:radical SAM family heme chaperone HemW [Candidatus Bandiella woodruffii]WPX95912.1 Oxygen-independent coproporphyrinogen-III oxidase 1 [Candidatus Bandiella woodruffii]